MLKFIYYIGSRYASVLFQITMINDWRPVYHLLIVWFAHTFLNINKIKQFKDCYHMYLGRGRLS